MPNIERTGWRDERISARHRLWGEDLYFTDIDFCGIEYYSKKGILLVDYKDWHKKDGLYIHGAGHKALGWLADGRNIPACIVIYQLDVQPHSFEIIPLNDSALRYFGPRQIVSEEQWIKYQYHLRGLAIDEQFKQTIEKLNNESK